MYIHIACPEVCEDVVHVVVPFNTHVGWNLSGEGNVETISDESRIIWIGRGIEDCQGKLRKNSSGWGVFLRIYQGIQYTVPVYQGVSLQEVWPSLENLLVALIVYPFSHNHGSVENYPNFKETNLGDTPILHWTMIVDGRVYQYIYIHIMHCRLQSFKEVQAQGGWRT